MTARTDATSGRGDGAAGTLSDEERAALKERTAELRVSGRGRGAAKAEADAKDVLAKIAELPEPDRSLAERVHAVVTAAGPELAPKLWYGMPAYARDGKIVCFFQGSQKFKTRYSTLGFNDAAHLDDGAMWPTAYALTALGDTEEEAIVALIRRALG